MMPFRSIYNVLYSALQNLADKQSTYLKSENTYPLLRQNIIQYRIQAYCCVNKIM